MSAAPEVVHSVTMQHHLCELWHTSSTSADHIGLQTVQWYGWRPQAHATEVWFKKLMHEFNQFHFNLSKAVGSRFARWWHMTKNPACIVLGSDTLPATHQRSHKLPLIIGKVWDQAPRNLPRKLPALCPLLPKL